MDVKLSFCCLIFYSSFVSIGYSICNNIEDISSDFLLARTNKQTSFYTDDTRFLKISQTVGCPILNDSCLDTYSKKLKKSTEVIINKTKINGLYCSNKIYNTNDSGFISSNDLIVVSNQNYNSDLLIGNWIDSYGVSKLTVSKKNNLLHFIGNSVWYGLVDENNERITHEGTFESNIVIPKINLFFTYNYSTDCLIKFNFVNNKYLVLNDNSNCGGMNVRFNGIYHKI